jgi:hypothetical protein
MTVRLTKKVNASTQGPHIAKEWNEGEEKCPSRR